MGIQIPGWRISILTIPKKLLGFAVLWQSHGYWEFGLARRVGAVRGVDGMYLSAGTVPLTGLVWWRFRRSWEAILDGKPST
jgi:hypothetical protein